MASSNENVVVKMSEENKPVNKMYYNFNFGLWIFLIGFVILLCVYWMIRKMSKDVEIISLKLSELPEFKGEVRS